MKKNWSKWTKGAAIASSLLLSIPAHSQLTIAHKHLDDSLIRETLQGTGITINEVAKRGADEGIGLFRSNGTVIPFEEGIVLSTGRVEDIPGKNKTGGTTGMHNTYGDRQDLEGIAGQITFDAVFIEVNFIPVSEIFHFDFVFASEEYPEYVGSQFNDVFAFILIDPSNGSRTNLAVIPTTGEPITVNTLNDRDNKAFYIENHALNPDSQTENSIEFDGLSKVLTAYSRVVPGQKYQLKIALADAGDRQLDSGVFIETGSFGSSSQSEFVSEKRDYFLQFDKAEKSPEMIELLALETPVAGSEADFETVETITPIESVDTEFTPKEEVPVETQSDESVEVETKTESESIATASAGDSLVVYFQFDSYILNDSSLNAIESFKANHLNGIASISGHTDNKGSKDYNLLLSLQRAEVVKGTFGDRSIPIEAKYYAQPAESNANGKGRAANRRVVIKAKP